MVGQGVNALVDALVVAANEQQVVGGGELIGVGVVEGAALGGEKDDLGAVLLRLPLGRGCGVP